MKDILDLHTHTIASGHAYNTMNEMIAAAKLRGLEIYGITEHAPRMNGSFVHLAVLGLYSSVLTSIFPSGLRTATA